MALELIQILETIGIYAFFIIFIIGVAYFKDHPKVQILSEFDTEKFLPTDEVYYLKQIFLLLMSALYVFGFLSMWIMETDYIDISLLGLCLTIISILYISKKDYKNIILCILIIPAPVIMWLFNVTLFYLLIIHYVGIFICSIYFIYQFLKFTKQNNLGLTVLIFVLIVISSFFVTVYSEGTNLVDSICMVSNAFTSNGYTVLGTSVIGKLDSILLVWGGYLLSGVGTATLTATILVTYLKSRIDSQEEKIDNLTNEIKELKELMKK